MISVVGRYHAEIAIEILLMDRSSPSPGAGRNRSRRRSVAFSGHDCKRCRVISTKKSKE